MQYYLFTNYLNFLYSLHDSDTVFLHVMLRLCPDITDPCPDFLLVFWTGTETFRASLLGHQWLAHDCR